MLFPDHGAAPGQTPGPSDRAAQAEAAQGAGSTVAPERLSGRVDDPHSPNLSQVARICTIGPVAIVNHDARAERPRARRADLLITRLAAVGPPTGGQPRSDPPVSTGCPRLPSGQPAARSAATRPPRSPRGS